MSAQGCLLTAAELEAEVTRALRGDESLGTAEMPTRDHPTERTP